MPAAVTLRDARALLGDDVLGPEEVRTSFGGVAVEGPPIPFSGDELTKAHAAGAMLVLRLAQAGSGVPLTITHLLQQCPDAFDEKLLRHVGYQLKDEWGIALEPLAATDTCSAGWALARKEILSDTRNRAYDEQEPALQRFAQEIGARAVRRRTAIEAVYDTVLYYRARQARLLQKAWDWSATRTVDGGYLNVGGFGSNGMQILSFSRAVRHGALGICPTGQPQT
jgi:hypothetical protein